MDSKRFAQRGDNEGRCERGRGVEKRRVDRTNSRFRGGPDLV